MDLFFNPCFRRKYPKREPVAFRVIFASTLNIYDPLFLVLINTDTPGRRLQIPRFTRLSSVEFELTVKSSNPFASTKHLNRQTYIRISLLAVWQIVESSNQKIVTRISGKLIQTFQFRLFCFRKKAKWNALILLNENNSWYFLLKYTYHIWMAM